MQFQIVYLEFPRRGLLQWVQDVIDVPRRRHALLDEGGLQPYQDFREHLQSEVLIRSYILIPRKGTGRQR
jgi:hypothetical protein